MKAVILAAGRGTRMRPLTDVMPKHLVPFAGKPFIVHTVERMLPYFEEVIIIVWYLKEQIIQTVREYFPEANIRFIEQEQPLGTGDAVKYAQPHVDDYFFLIHGDVCFEARAFEELANFNESVCTLIEVDDPENHHQVEYCNGAITKFYGTSGSVDAGAWVLPKKIYDYLQKQPDSGELRILHAINRLFEEGEPVKAFHIHPPWLQFGDHSGIPGVLEVMRYFLKMNGSKTNKPDCSDSTIEDSDVQIALKNCKIRNSLVFGGGQIADCKIEDSVIRCDCAVKGKSIVREIGVINNEK